MDLPLLPRSLLLKLLVLLTALSPSCSKRSQTPVVAPIVHQSCVTPDQRARWQAIQDFEKAMTACSNQGSSLADCVTHDDRVVRALVAEMVAGCPKDRK